MAASSKLTIRMTEGEARILRAQAIRQGVTLSAFARHQILHGGNGNDAAVAEQIVNQILPVIEARFDVLEAELQSTRAETRGMEERSSERLKKAVQILFEEIRKK